MRKKLTCCGIALIMLICLVIGSAKIFDKYFVCRDPGGSFYYNVVGENGILTIEGYDGESPRHFFGIGHSANFIAIPDEGYQVKEWTQDGKVVEGNKTNCFYAVIDKGEYSTTITVEFEPIPEELL